MKFNEGTQYVLYDFVHPFRKLGLSAWLDLMLHGSITMYCRSIVNNLCPIGK